VGSFLAVGSQAAKARVGIVLEKVDFEGKNSLIPLLIQNYCETLLQDGFTRFC
jgi:hypothetical protein